MNPEHQQLRIGIVAGERSGDLLGAGLIRELKQRIPNCQFIGIGGPGMVAEGCQSLVPMDRLSVMGFIEPLGRLPELFAIKRQLTTLFSNNPPAVFIGIDSPDFNLRLAATLKQQGIPTVHYVSPSVWAYRKNRIYKIKAAVDLMLTLFPFETEIYAQHNIAVQCVGHPLADTIGFEDQRSTARAQYQLGEQEPVVALLPGSRGGEIARLAPVFLGAAKASLSELPALKFLLPSSGAESRARLEQQLKQAAISGHDQFQLVENSQMAMAAADFLLLASGTATLEAMLLRRPMAVAYKLAPLTYMLASRIVNVPHIALPNLLSGERLVPEYIQHEVTVPALSQEITHFFNNHHANQPMLEKFEHLHRELRQDASATAAAAIQNLIAKQVTGT